MAKTAYINTRVDKKLKADAEEVLAQIGVSISDLITMTLKQVVLHDGLPYPVRVPNKETRKAIEELRAGKGKTYSGSTKDIFDAILKER